MMNYYSNITSDYYPLDELDRQIKDAIAYLKLRKIKYLISTEQEQHLHLISFINKMIIEQT